MFEPPALSDVFLASALVGLLFLVRFVLTMRRHGTAVAPAGETLRERLRRAVTPGGFGAEREPERRHASRQLVTGSFFLAVGVILGVWLAATGGLR